MLKWASVTWCQPSLQRNNIWWHILIILILNKNFCIYITISTINYVNYMEDENICWIVELCPYFDLLLTDLTQTVYFLLTEIWLEQLYIMYFVSETLFQEFWCHCNICVSWNNCFHFCYWVRVLITQCSWIHNCSLHWNVFWTFSNVGFKYYLSL